MKCSLAEAIILLIAAVIQLLAKALELWPT